MQPASPTPAATFRSARLAAGLLALITAAALLLRLFGVGFLLPKMVETDSRVLMEQVRYLELGEEHPERDRNFVFYPLLMARTIVLASDPAVFETPARDLREHLRRAAAPHKRIRTFVAILSVLLVPGTWLLARKFLPSAGALLAASFMATSTLHLWFAQQGRPHAASAAFALFAVLAALRLRREGRPRDYALAGIALGLAAGSLQSGLVAILPFAAAVCLREGSARKASWAWALTSLAILAACVALFYPTAFSRDLRADSATFAIEGNVLRLSGHIIFLDQLRGQGFRALLAALRDYEPWIAALALLGIVVALLGLARGLLDRTRRHGDSVQRGDLIVVLAFAVPYAIAAGLYARTYQRFSIPLLPFLCCLAAYAAVRISGRLPALGRAIVALVLLAPQAWLAWRLNEARRAPDTIDLAAQWVSEHIDAGRERVLVLPSFELPLPQTAGAMEASRPMSDNINRPWYRYQDGLPKADRPKPAFDLVAMPMVEDEVRASIARDPVSYLRAQRAQWAVIEVFGEGRRPPVLGSIRKGLAEVADRVARFVPDRIDEGMGEGQDLPITYQDDELPQSSPWTWRTACAGRVGPVVEVWRFR